MCGIAGYGMLSAQSSAIDHSLLVRMHEAIAHRGPDGFGVWIDQQRGMGLAHRRLSIVDLSPAGSQPMLDMNEHVAISFNGEIYNHQKLRKELEALGYRYRSNSDTETILYAYQAWGIKCLKRLDGMFAFALFDREKNELYLVRDRIGIKPLYFSLQGGMISFASEIKALWQLPWNKKIISSQALYHYLTFMVTPAPYTFYNDIYKLPAAYYLKVDAQRAVTFHEWYSPITTITPAEHKQFYDEQFCLENIKALLIDSTKKRLMSDVPFGAFLSGGLDSSLNVALMSQFVSKVKTFTVAFADGPESNELVWARQVAAQFGTQHHEIVITEKEAFDFYEKMVYHLDEPLADCVCIPFYYVAKLAHDHGVNVVQVGEGADELFFGYSTYAQYKNLYDRLWRPSQKVVPGFLKRSITSIANSFFDKQSNYAALMINWAKNRDLFWGGALAFNEQQKRALVHEDIFKASAPQEDQVVGQILKGAQQDFDSHAIVAFHGKTLKAALPDADFAAKMMYLELKQRLPELLLMRADKMAMATSVEAREPYLDYKLVEFMLHVPATLKFKDGVSKYLLKTIALDYLPPSIVFRKKVGFAAPTVRWFASGSYFPRYFAGLNTQASALFSDKIKTINSLGTNSAAMQAVQQWVVQNVLALTKGESR